MIHTQSRTVTTRPQQPVKLYSREFNRDLHQSFARLRHEAPVAPAWFTRWQKAYLITRYEDAVTLLKDERLSKNLHNGNSGSDNLVVSWMLKGFEPLMHNMLNSDDPDHRRLRNLVHKAFTPRIIADLAPRIEAICNQLLDQALAKGTIDLVTDFALPLPVTIIAELIGIPEADRPRFRHWTERFVVTPTPLNMLRMIPSIRQFMRFARDLAAQRRRQPQDDLLSGLAQAEDQGEQLSDDELVAMVFLLLVAGHETTVNLIANGTFALLTHPDQMALLRKNPALVESAVEEMLRFDGPVMTTELNFARQPIELHGVTIPKGAVVLPVLLSANRDETVFPNPDQFDIQRSPNRHLGFGHGIHYCLGAPLARLEAQIAFRTLLARTQTLQLAVDAQQIAFENVMILHRLPHLPVTMA